MEPLSAIAITSLAFIATKAGEKALDKSLDAFWDKVNLLRKKIMGKLDGNPTAVKALTQAETGNEDAFESVADYLKIAMREDPDFAKEIQQLAQEIDQEAGKDDSPMTQIIRDHGRGWQTTVKGGTAYIGDIKIYQNPPA